MKRRVPGVLAFVLGAMVLTGLPFASAQEKAKPHVLIPEADDVSLIRFDAEKVFPGGPFALNLSKPEEVKPLLTWLKGVGWDYSKSRDARVIDVPLWARITIIRKDKAKMHFSVSDRLIIAADRAWPIDNGKLEAVVKQVRAAAK